MFKWSVVVGKKANLLVDKLAQRNLGSSLDLEADELVDLVPMPSLEALVAEVDYHGKDWAEVVHIILLWGCTH